MTYTGPTFLHYLTCGGTRPWFPLDWRVGLLSVVCANADAQAARPQVWRHWLALDYGVRAWAVTGGMN